MRKFVVYINVNEQRKKSFFAIQAKRIKKKRQNLNSNLSSTDRAKLTKTRSLKLFQNVKTH